MKNNKEYFTYSEFIKLLESRIQKKISQSTFKINLTQKLKGIVNLKLGYNFLQLIGYSSLIFSIYASAYPLFLPPNQTSLIPINFMFPLLGLGIKNVLTSEKLEKIVDNITRLKLTSLKRNKDFHLYNQGIRMRQSSNLKMPYNLVFNQLSNITFTDEQKKTLFHIDDVDYVLKLLENYSIITINFHIANKNCNKLETFADVALMREINEASEKWFNELQSLIDFSKKNSRNTFIKYTNLFSSIPYSFNTKSSQKTSTYNVILSKISDRIENELQSLNDKLNYYYSQLNNYITELQNCQNNAQRNQLQKRINTQRQNISIIMKKIDQIKIRAINIKDCFTICDDLLPLDEQIKHLPNDLENSLYNLLQYYPISTITLCLFEGKLDILSNILSQDLQTRISQTKQLNSLSNEVLLDCRKSKKRHQLAIQNQYQQEFDTIASKKRTYI